MTMDQHEILDGDFGDPAECVCEAPPLLYTPNPGDRPLPPAPTFAVKPYQGRAALNAAFGRMQVADGKIIRVTMPNNSVITGAMWEARFMTSAKNLPLIGHAYINKVIEDPLRWLLGEWEKEGGYTIEQFGCFSPRAKATNPDAISLHSPAIAFDINPKKNPLSPADKPQLLITNIPDRWFALARLAGFTCGRDFKGRKDPMHFQYAAGV